MNAKLDAGDTNTRKGYIRSIIDAVEVLMIKPSGSSAARTFFRPPLPADRTRTEMFVVLYANGAPFRMKLRTHMLLIFRYNSAADLRPAGILAHHSSN
ncbi:hypothetical protein G8O24_29055 [Bradyrhizobium sp. INPA01-394B]|jgi:hypothetical protein|uniref:Uncharacterized protein n=1 Tax=Bradyrhizobium campsiandrae TaxID=1729892 RepID=A0ABR7UJG1_9BRAD|nr:hypothetical protein [Bradyrhizobium campsiandrae]MBC9881380.1 hypothetical protein [Bradyrhizobium campsiandrae]MBC9983760.1 hypothetical protein [Bradyrhizobium campsiandrae]